MAKCPMMKASAPRDLVAINELRSDKILQPVHFLSLTALEMPRKVILRLASFVKSIQSIFLTPQQSVRAPPSDVHLQDA